MATRGVRRVTWGKPGTIVDYQFATVLPESSARGERKPSERFYTVEFDGRDLSGDDTEPGAGGIRMGLWESYLEPIVMTENPAARMGALEEMLTERVVVDAETVERIASYYETQVGPMVGAGVVARSSVDPAFRERLRASPTKALAEVGIGGLESEHIIAVERAQVHNVVVCTLCRATRGGARPTAGLVQVAGVPQPDRPRAAQGPHRWASPCAPEVEIKVWDSTAELRYAMAVPERPPGTDALDEEALGRW